ncbi:hypothetical protein BH11MYX1_BH11MYX1_41800 [soil metagenome]
MFSRKQLEWLWVPLLYTLALLWIYRGLWHQHGAATGFGWDTIDTHGPDLDFFASDLAHHRFSLWNPYDKGGYPVFCDPVFDRYYPLNWPFAAWGAVFGTSWWLVQIKVFAHHVIAASMLHLFLRTRGLSVRASLIGGLGLVASAPLLIHKASNIVWPLVWVPLVWLAIDAALATPSWRRGVLVGGALLLPLTAGSPPGLVYAALLIAPYAGLRLVQRLRAHRSREELLALARCIAAAVVVAGLVAAVTLIPTSQLVALCDRDRLGSGPEFALSGSTNLWLVVRGVFIRGGSPFELYCGSAVVLLAAIGLVQKPRADRGAPVALFGTALLGMILAAGVTALVLPWLVAHVPPFALLRIPGRYKLLAAWGFAAAAAYGVAVLEARSAPRKVWIFVGVAVAVVIACVELGGLPAAPKDHPAWWSIVAIAIAGALVVAAVALPRRLADVAFAALALAVLSDFPLFTFVEPAAPPAAEPRQTHEADATIVAQLEGVRDRWRLYDEFVLGERAGARLGIRDFRGYPAVDPISLHRYVDVLDYAKGDPRILTDFNVRYVLARPHFRYARSALFLHEPLHGFTRARNGWLWEANHPAPIVAWYGAVKVVAEKPLAALRAEERPDGQRLRAVVEARDAFALPPAAVIGTPAFREGAITSYAPDKIVYEIDAPSAGLAVLNEIMFPGWHVSVDGVHTASIRANYLLRGVWVTAGHHEVIWEFAPDHWRSLVGGYVLALIVIVGAALYRRLDDEI